MKKILSILLIAASTATMLAGCGSSATDWSYIEEKGKMTIGITYFEPMNYVCLPLHLVLLAKPTIKAPVHESPLPRPPEQPWHFPTWSP